MGAASARRRAEYHTLAAPRQIVNGSGRGVAGCVTRPASGPGPDGATVNRRGRRPVRTRRDRRSSEENGASENHPRPDRAVDSTVGAPLVAPSGLRGVHPHDRGLQRASPASPPAIDARPCGAAAGHRLPPLYRGGGERHGPEARVTFGSRPHGSAETSQAMNGSARSGRLGGVGEPPGEPRLGGSLAFARRMVAYGGVVEPATRVVRCSAAHANARFCLAFLRSVPQEQLEPIKRPAPGPR